MTEKQRALCKLLAFLFEYPTVSWREELKELDEATMAAAGEKRQDLLQQFLSYAGTTSSIELQEVYTKAFDLDPAASLHLTYHLMGDSEDRGKALAGLLWIYHREGYDAPIGELPDYLPMMLEFLSLCPDPEDAELLWSCLGTVSMLGGRLEDKKHPYAGLMRLAAEIIQPHLAVPSGKMGKEV